MNRYYGSNLGRFLTADPYGPSAKPGDPQSWNRYAYVSNDPVNKNDPTGFFEEGQQPEPPRYCDLVPDDPVCSGGRSNTFVDDWLAEEERQARLRRENPKNEDYMEAAMQRALKALEIPECAGVFGTAPGRLKLLGVTASSVLQGIKTGNGGKYGRIQFEDKGSDWGTAETVPQLPQFFMPRILWGRSNKVTITINSYSDGSGQYWNDGDELGNANTVLHELGHLLRFLGFKGGEFVQRDGRESVNEANRRLGA